MDDVRAVEVLTRVRNMGWEGREITDALDHAIATIERVAGAPVVRLYLGDRDDSFEVNSPDEAAAIPVGKPIRLVPDPQPDGQEG